MKRYLICDEEANHEGEAEPQYCPPLQYNDADTTYTGIDIFGRRLNERYDDRCISTINGRFVPLEVQCTPEVLRGKGGATWSRKQMKAVGPLTLRVAELPFSNLPGALEGLDVLKFEDALKSEDKDPKKRAPAALQIFWKSLLLVPLMMPMGTFFRPSSGEIRNGCRYDPVPYRYFGRAKTSRNPKDDRVAGEEFHSQARSKAPGHPLQNESVERSAKERVERVLLPRKLCFLDTEPTPRARRQTGQHYLKFHSTDIQQWTKQNNKSCPKYLFVAWIGKHFDGGNVKDRQRLHELARYATKEAGLPCYWISLNCRSEDPQKKILDVWRMSDVVRGSAKLAVIVRSPESGESVEDPLREWASSIWTFPELLLSPETEFTTYYSSSATSPSSSPVIRKKVIAKNQFSARCLVADEDRYQVRRLLDHYLGSLKLSDLELMAVALHCFSSRVTSSQFLSGDHTYALMGLLGHRPPICRSDSPFLAFARLSLENYNSRLFERFVCLSPVKRDQPWHMIKDAYGSQLWDIEPNVQVAGIGVYDESVAHIVDPVTELEFEREHFLASPHGAEDEDQDEGEGEQLQTEARFRAPETETTAEPKLMPHSKTRSDDVVILDGCYAATVHWDRFHRVWHAKRLSYTRRLLKWILRLNFIPLIIGLVLAGLGSPSLGLATMTVIGALFLIYSLGIYLAAPLIIRTVWAGKFWETQPWFFGFEGYMPIEKIERKIFGSCKGRLTWSYYASSPLSHHKIEDGRWVVSQDPIDDQETKSKVEKAHHAKHGDSRVFTIVDTYAMTATLFEANRPPEVLLVCGSEGGMQRALGCSFEWTTSTFYKETVLRLETRVLERMDRIRRVRLGLKRQEKDIMEL